AAAGLKILLQPESREEKFGNEENGGPPQADRDIGPEVNLIYLPCTPRLLDAPQPLFHEHIDFHRFGRYLHCAIIDRYPGCSTGRASSEIQYRRPLRRSPDRRNRVRLVAAAADCGRLEHRRIDTAQHSYLLQLSPVSCQIEARAESLNGGSKS